MLTDPMQMMQLFGADSKLDRDRLALAVYLARRDVTQLISGTAAQPEPRKKTDSSFRRPSVTTTSVPRSRLEPKISSDVVKRSPDLESDKKPKPVPPFNDVMQGQRREHPSESSSLPVRGTSPPTRDIEPGSTSRCTRPLHAPTEKQLRFAKESHLRQLQAKIARYSSALAELRIRPAPTVQTDADPTNARPLARQTRTRPGNSLSSRSAPRRPRSASVLQHRVVPVGFKNHAKPLSTRSDTSNWRTCGRRAAQEKPNKQSSNSEQQRIREQVNALWAQARQSLNVLDNELIVLESESPLQNPSLLPSSDLFPHATPREPRKSENQINEQETEFTAGTASNKSQSLQTTQNPYVLHTKKASDIATTPNTRLAVDDLLTQLDEAEAEENSIRRRWAHLAFGFDQEDFSRVNKGTIQPAALATNSRSRLPSHHFEGPSDMLGGISSMRKSEDHPKQPTNKHIVFTNTTPTVPVTSTKTRLHQNAQASGGLVNSQLTLRLPTQFHRRLLLEAAQRQSRFSAVCKKHNILTVDDCKNIHPARVCEWLADELVEQLLSQVVVDIERETSELVEEIVEGELHTEASDSTLTTNSNVSYLEDTPTPVNTPLSRVEDQAAVSGSKTPTPRIATRTDSSPIPVDIRNTHQHSEEELTSITSSKRPSNKVDATEYSLEFDGSTTGDNWSPIPSSNPDEGVQRLSTGHELQSRSLSSATLIATQALHQVSESMEDLTDRIIDSPLLSG